MVPAGLILLTSYHAWLLYKIIYHPTATFVELNALNREIWVDTVMADGIKNGVLAVQTLWNNIMASTLLASTTITLNSLIDILFSSSATAAIVYRDDSKMGSPVKYFTILLCFLVAFLFNVHSIMYYSHVIFVITVPPTKQEAGHSQSYVSRSLNRVIYFLSLGFRPFYFLFPLFLWTFGPIPMFSCCCIMISTLYFLDIATTAHTATSLALSLPRSVEERCSPTVQERVKV